MFIDKRNGDGVEPYKPSTKYRGAGGYLPDQETIAAECERLRALRPPEPKRPINEIDVMVIAVRDITTFEFLPVR